MSSQHDRLDALSPLDGRYAETTAPLAACFSERRLMALRVRVECAYLLALLEAVGHPGARREDVARAVTSIAEGFGPDDARAVKAIEARTRHDVKAVEYWLKERVAGIDGLGDAVELVHAGLTSEDVNNLAWGLAHLEATRQVLLPALADVMDRLLVLGEAHAELPMLARTHGQPASPTTFGKEVGVFLSRLAHTLDGVAARVPGGKLSGASGTHAALQWARPDIDWPAFSRRFVTGLGLVPVAVTTQIEPRDRTAALYDAWRRTACVLLDLCQDLWRYVSDGWLRQRAVEGEVGSSAMPHKVNPIDFENAEGNLGLAIVLLGHLGDKLAVSRLQRDLSDSTVLRNAGVAFGHLLVALTSLARGLERIAPDPEAMAAALRDHPEVLAEAIQTAARFQGAEAPYEALQALLRGRRGTLEGVRAAGAALDAANPEAYRTLEPGGYVGCAPALARTACDEAREAMARCLAGGTGGGAERPL